MLITEFMRKIFIESLSDYPSVGCADSSPDKVSLNSFCELNAAPLGEVSSAICAEAGGVNRFHQTFK